MSAAECEAGVYFPSILSQIQDLEDSRSRSAQSRRVQVLSMLISTWALAPSVVSPLSKVKLNRMNALKGK